MKIILLSGGAGKRLWPISNSIRSKQFIKLLTSPSGDKESMLQRAVRQIKDVGLSDDIIVMTGIDQKGLIENQVGDKLTIITEPARRNTFPAIYLACAYLYSQGTPTDETVIVLPCDSFASDEYFSLLRNIDEAVSRNSADLVLMGITPTYPSSKYGYIVPANDRQASQSGISPIKEFVEKPEITDADNLIKMGALWNGGVYGFKLGYMIDLGFCTFGIKDFQSLVNKYSDLPNSNFSYEVLEKADCSKAVISYAGDWKDIGTWDALTSEINAPTYGNVKSLDCNRTYIVNELDKPLVCMGCNNMIVAASHDGILVADLDDSENIKHLIGDLPAEPKYREYRWGISKTIGETVPTEDGLLTQTQQLEIKSGCATDYQSNQISDEVWLIAAGKGEIAIDGSIKPVEQNFTTLIPKGAFHAVRATSPMTIIVIRQNRPNSENIYETSEFAW